MAVDLRPLVYWHWIWVFSLKCLYKQMTLNNYTIVQLAVCPVIGNISPPLYKLVLRERDSCINSIECYGLLTTAQWTNVCPWTQIRMQLHSTGVRHIHKHIFSPIDGHLWTRGCGKSLNILYVTELCFAVHVAMNYKIQCIQSKSSNLIHVQLKLSCPFVSFKQVTYIFYQYHFDKA